MNREELKRLWFTIPHGQDKAPTRTIVVTMDKYKGRIGQGTVQITRDASDGYKIINMKKIALSVVALSMTVMSYGQTNDNSYQEQVKTFKAFEYQILDLIDAVRMDMYYGFLSRDKGNYYINEMMKLSIANKQAIAELSKNKFAKL